MPINSLDQKFVYELGAVYDAELRYLDAQRQMVQRAGSEQITSMLQNHIQETEQQIRNIEQCFDILGQPAQRINCEGAAGLVADGQKLLREIAGNNSRLLDVAIAGSQMKVEHSEIAAYRGLIAGAELKNQTQIVDLLRRNLQQEERTAQRIEQAMPGMLQQAMTVEAR